MTKGKVLVLGDDTRSFLAITRSLGRQGIAVHAAPANFASPALSSRYIARIHRLPPYMDDGAEWLAGVEALLDAERFELVIPCDETTLLPFWRHRAALEARVRLAIPDDRAIDVLFDKHATRELAASLGVNVAPGRLPRPGDTAADLLAELGRPLVVKPRRSYSEALLHQRAKVQVTDDPVRLGELLAHADPAETLLESFRPGHGVGVSVLAHDGRVLQAFEHHRVRETGSGSFYRVSAPLTPAFSDACTAMVAALGYTGVAMFEFRRGGPAGTGPGEWVLLEVNARPWGSLPLPVGLGVDFPYRWYRLLVHGEETPAVDYPVGRYGRNLLPDIRGIVAEAELLPGGSLARLAWMCGRFAEMARVFTGRERHDVLVADDRKPGLVELRQEIAHVAGRVLERLPGAASLRRARSRAALQRARSGAAPLRVVVVCQGNICRSPFAAALLRARLGSTANIEVASFGMLPRPGRPTPDFGITAAAAHGIDLAAHRSAWFAPEEAAAAGVVLIFDDINRAAIHARYPDLAAPVLSLGDFASPPLRHAQGRIDDPVDGDQAVFDASYAEIARAVDGLVVLLQRS